MRRKQTLALMAAAALALGSAPGTALAEEQPESVVSEGGQGTEGGSSTGQGTGGGSTIENVIEDAGGGQGNLANPTPSGGDSTPVGVSPTSPAEGSTSNDEIPNTTSENPDTVGKGNTNEGEDVGSVAESGNTDNGQKVPDTPTTRGGSTDSGESNEPTSTNSTNEPQTFGDTENSNSEGDGEGKKSEPGIVIGENGVETRTYEDGVKSEYDPATGTTSWYNENNEYQGTTSQNSDNTVTFTRPNMKSLRFAKGADSDKAYDEAGNLISSTTHNAEDSTSTTDYYAEGKVYRTEVKDKDGNVQKTMDYDSDGQIYLSSEYDSEGRRVEVRYGVDGQPSSTRVFEKDSNDFTETYADGSKYVYDSALNVTTFFNAQEKVVSVHAENPEGTWTATYYDDNGNIDYTTTGDRNGGLQTTTFADGSKHTYDPVSDELTQYDKDNNLVSTIKYYNNSSFEEVWADGSKVVHDGATGTTTMYNADERVIGLYTVDSDGRAVGLRYKDDGEIDSITISKNENSITLFAVGARSVYDQVNRTFVCYGEDEHVIFEAHYEGDVLVVNNDDGTSSEYNEKTGASLERNSEGEITNFFAPPTLLNTVEDENGNKTETYDNGTKIEYHADGSRAEYTSDGMVLLVDVDGTRTFYYPDGYKYVYSADDSRYEGYDPKGNLISYSDKMVEAERMTDDAGNETVRYTSGMVVEYRTDGTQIETYPDGKVYVISVDPVTGFTVRCDKDGNFVSKQKVDHETGESIFISADGYTCEVKADGTRIDTYADGTRRVVDKDNTETVYDADGNVVRTVTPNPIVKTVYGEDGARIDIYQDGGRSVYNLDGSKATYDADGNLLDSYVPDHITKITVDENGNQAVTFESGIKTEWHTDGTVTTTDPVKGTVTVYDSAAGTTTVTDQKSGVTTVTDWASDKTPVDDQEKVPVDDEGNVSGGGSGGSPVSSPDDIRDNIWRDVNTPEAPILGGDNVDDFSSSSDYESKSDSDTSNTTSNDAVNTDADKKDAAQQPAVQKEVQEAARVAAEQVVSELTAIGNDANAYFGEDSAIIKDVQEIVGIAAGEDVVLSNVAPLSTEGIVAGEPITLDLDAQLKPNSTVAVLIGVPGPDGKIEWVAVKGVVDENGKVSFTLDDTAVARIASGNAIMALASTPDAIA